MRCSARGALAAAATVFLAVAALADTVLLKDGRRIAGRAVDRGTLVEVEVRGAIVRFPREQVEKIEWDGEPRTAPPPGPGEASPGPTQGGAGDGRPPVPGGTDGGAESSPAAAALWASLRELMEAHRFREAGELAQVLLKQHPGSAEAQRVRALGDSLEAAYYHERGYVQVDGRWLDPRQQREAQGEVLHLDAWMDGARHREWLAAQTAYSQYRQTPRGRVWTDVPSEGDGFLEWAATRLEAISAAYEGLLLVQDLSVPSGGGSAAAAPVAAGKVDVKIARDMLSHMRAGAPGPVLGSYTFYEGQDKRTPFINVCYRDGLAQRGAILPTIIHFVGHHQLLSRLPLAPYWIREGLAEYCALTELADPELYRSVLYDDLHIMSVQYRREAKRYDTVGELARLKFAADADMGHYAEAWLAVKALMDNYPAEFRRYLAAVQTAGEHPLRKGESAAELGDFLPSGGAELEARRVDAFFEEAQRTYRRTIATYPIDRALDLNTLLAIHLLYTIPILDSERSIHLSRLLLHAYPDLGASHSTTERDYAKARAKWRADRLKTIFRDRDAGSPLDGLYLHTGGKIVGIIIAETRGDVEIILPGRQRQVVPKARIRDIRRNSESGVIVCDLDDARPAHLGAIAAADAYRRLGLLLEEVPLRGEAAGGLAGGKPDRGTPSAGGVRTDRQQRAEALRHYREMEGIFDDLGVLDAVAHARARLRLIEGR